jgi:ACS family tartrate transporter-like MFS transporter
VREVRPDLERVTLGKVIRRLLPFLFLLYVFNILDRVNIGIAVLTMRGDLGFSEAVYGLGAGMFFVGYFFFEVPSNIVLNRLGARVWIARIMLTWGAIASCMMFIRTPASFYGLRFLLGVAEAGFFPGIMFYLTQWFPNVVRGRAAARFILANVTASIIGGPLGAQFLQLDGLGGLRGWQWLFLMEGLPTIVLGVVVLFYMTDRPEQAHWLRPEEREWLVQALASERAHRQRYHHMTLLRALRYPRVLHLSAIFFLNILAGSGLGLFTNLILKQRTGWTDQRVLWIGTIPAILGAASMLLSAAHSDRTRERRLHVAFGLGAAAFGIALCGWVRSPVMTLVALSTISIGGAVANAPFWALTTGFLSGAAAAGGIAFINSIGNSGSFFGPVLMGILKERTKMYELGLFVLAGVMAAASLVAFLLPPDPAEDRRSGSNVKE